MSTSSAYSGFASEQSDLADKLLESSPVAVLLVDAGEHIARANKRAEAMFGLNSRSYPSLSPVVGRIYRRDGTPFPYEDMPGVRALRGEVVIGEEALLDRPDGEKVPLVVSADSVRDREGSIVGAIVVMDDLSPVKELERLRLEWTSIIAHDLRQPVTVILGYARQLATLRGGSLARMRMSIEHIQASTYQISRMVNDLLEAARADVWRLPIQTQTVDLSALIATIVERFSRASTDQPSLVCRADDNIPALDVDPSRLEQIVGNLLSNAAKHAHPGTDIHVAVRRKDGEVEVSVSNHGDGIPPEDLPRLFTRYHRPDRSKDQGGTGLGLGLYIARGLVEAHGGRIWAESVPGKLTTFYFTIPERGGEQ